MGTTSVVDLNELKRDWVEGVSGNTFFRSVQQYIDRIDANGSVGFSRGVLIAESDAVKFAAAFFACAHRGVPMILANPKWQKTEWDQVISLVSPALAFGKLPKQLFTTQVINHPLKNAILIPTGGSSGKIKFAVHTWNTLAAACDGFFAFAGVGPINSCCTLPLFHVSGLMQLMRSFLSNGQITFTDIKALQADKFPMMNASKLCISLVSTQLRRLLLQRSAVEWLSRVRFIFIGGGPLSKDLKTRIRHLRLPVVVAYGMTETAAMVAALEPDMFHSGSESVGQPLKHVDLQVINRDGLRCEPGISGRIQISSSSLCSEYIGSNKGFLEKSFLSNDEGYLDAKGYLHIIGRVDRMVISGGEKVDPSEIEQVILATGVASEVLVVGWLDSEWGEQLIAFYVPMKSSVSVQALELKLRKLLVNYKMPKQIVEVSELPLTGHGKLNRSLIEKMLHTCD